VVRVGQRGDRTLTSVEGPDGDYDLAAPRAVACDGAGSGVRRMLCVETRWRDYGTDSAVADFGMECDLPKEVSRIVLDPRRPYGFFYFAPGRWRFIYRLNDSEDRRAMITEDATTELLKWKLPSALAPRFLWAERLPAGTGAERELPRGTQAARWRRGTRDGSVRGGRHDGGGARELGGSGGGSRGRPKEFH
jgi:2-polyprenyl-6-methoxyphenol hydroxylase-like FAD-dependent oxidoreductase